jgi:hypothetical protein
MKGNLYQHIKIRHAYDFSLCFPHELLMSFLNSVHVFIFALSALFSQEYIYLFKY